MFLSYPRHVETKKFWMPTIRSYFLKKLEPMVKFSASPVSRAEAAAPKFTMGGKGHGGLSSGSDNE